MCDQGDVRAGFSFCAEMRLAQSWPGSGWFGNNLYLWAFWEGISKGFAAGVLGVRVCECVYIPAD